MSLHTQQQLFTNQATDTPWLKRMAPVQSWMVHHQVSAFLYHHTDFCGLIGPASQQCLCNRTNPWGQHVQGHIPCSMQALMTCSTACLPLYRCVMAKVSACIPVKHACMFSEQIYMHCHLVHGQSEISMHACL